MTILEMIDTWKQGCSNAQEDSPEDCPVCTRELIDAIEEKLLAELEVL